MPTAALSTTSASGAGKKCYEVYKKADKPCEHCNSHETFTDGKSRVLDETGIDQQGRRKHYVVHTAPLRRSPDDPVEYVLEMSSDVTETRRWQQEYQILFDRVPCYVTVIDENFRIIRANEAFRERFGDAIGEHCYKVYKRRQRKCPHCPAAKTFKDGQEHRSSQIGTSRKGQRTYYQVTTSPLARGDDKVAHVIEISNDITDLKKLEGEMIEAERLAAVGQTVAGLAHSIKNILMGLEGRQVYCQPRPEKRQQRPGRTGLGNVGAEFRQDDDAGEGLPEFCQGSAAAGALDRTEQTG